MLKDHLIIWQVKVVIQSKFRTHVVMVRCGDEWIYEYDQHEVFSPQVIEPTKVVGRFRKRRTNKLYTPGRRVRGDVAV